MKRLIIAPFILWHIALNSHAHAPVEKRGISQTIDFTFYPFSVNDDLILTKSLKQNADKRNQSISSREEQKDPKNINKKGRVPATLESPAE